MRHLFIILFATTFFTKIYAQDPNFHIYLCFGQSNMEGQGTIQEQDKTVDKRFKVFQSLDCSNLNRDKNNWYTANPPLCQCWSKLSPADYFGRTMVACLPDSITIGIINVAVGGCDIRLFDKDLYQDYDSTYVASWFTNKVKDYGYNPYEHLIDLAKAAQKDGVIKGILLHQGETNTGNNEWPNMVNKIYSDIITDLSLNKEATPLLVGQVVSTPGSCCSAMNTIINKVPETIPTAHIISSSGCGAMDNAHFDSEGYREMGRRYAHTMLQIKNISFQTDTSKEIYYYSQTDSIQGQIQTVERLQRYLKNKKYKKAMALFSADQQPHLNQMQTDDKKLMLWAQIWLLSPESLERYKKMITKGKAPFVFEYGEWKIDER